MDDERVFIPEGQRLETPAEAAERVEVTELVQSLTEHVADMVGAFGHEPVLITVSVKAKSGNRVTAFVQMNQTSARQAMAIALRGINDYVGGRLHQLPDRPAQPEPAADGDAMGEQQREDFLNLPSATKRSM